MQITASNTPRNDSLDARSLLAIGLLSLLGLALVGIAAFRFGLVPTSATGAGDADLRIGADQMAFGTDTIHARAGEPLALQLDNSDFMPHSFDVDALEIHLEMPPRQDGAVEIDGLPAGTYTFYCAIPGHREAGMVGTLIVEK